VKNLLRVSSILLLLSACGPQSAKVPGVEEGVPTPVASTTDHEAYVLMHDLAMWKEDAGVLKWLKNLSIGDKVILKDQTGKFKTEGTDAERDYVKVAYGDKEGWVRPNYLATKAKLGAVISEKAKIYSEPRDIKVTGKFMSGMTLVAIFNEGGQGDYLKVAGYDYAQKVLLTDDIYINKSDITMLDSDVNAITLYIAATQAKAVDLKINLLSTALDKYSGSFFASQIESTLNDLKGISTKPSSAASGSFIVLEDNVNIRETSDETNGKVLGILAKDTIVEVTDMTTQSYTVDGKSAPWYKLADPQGWVFGAFLSPVQ